MGHKGMYKLIYIDEEIEDSNRFKRYVHLQDTNKEFNVEYIVPTETLEELIDQLIKHSPDAIVSDFELNEHIGDLGYAVPYSGTQLVESFLEIRTDFPCFVLTSYDVQAAQYIDDVNLIYDKNTYDDPENRESLTFLHRVKTQIEHYQHKLAHWQNEVDQLIRKRNEQGLDATEEETLIKLDSYLEVSIDGRNSLPIDVKSLSNQRLLEELIAKVNDLVEEVKNDS